MASIFSLPGVGTSCFIIYHLNTKKYIANQIIPIGIIKYHLVALPCKIPKMIKSITPPSVLPMLTPANETTISDNPCIIEWKTYKVGAMNKNRNSIGSDIPVTNETNIAETSNPLIENLFSFLAQ